MRISLFTFILLYGFTVHSAVTNFQILDGTSNLFDIRNNNVAVGVMAGPNSDPGPDIDITKPYNSCNIITPIDEISSCHPNRVDGQTVISIRFVETEPYAGSQRATATYTPPSSAQPAPVLLLAQSDLAFTQGQVANFEFTWGDVCRTALSGTMQNGRCVDGSGNSLSGNIPVSIGINNPSGATQNAQVSTLNINFNLYTPDPEIGVLPLGDGGPCDYSVPPTTTNGVQLTGVCEILPIPGDKAAFIETSLADISDVQTQFLGSSISYFDSYNVNSSGDPTTLSFNYTGIRVFFFDETVPVNEFLPSSDEVIFLDLPISSTSPVSFDDEKISGLQNGVTYTVLAASIDDSGTISQFFNPIDDIGGDGYCTNGSIGSLPSIGFCPQVTPSQVAGVIVDSSCFITTATYGSKSAYQVKTFQEFREKHLRGHTVGDWVIRIYNNYGPYAAVFINNNEYLKPAVRALLFPFYIFSSLILTFGVFWSLTFLIALLFMFWFISSRVFRRPSQ